MSEHAPARTLSFVIPAYDEEYNIEAAVGELHRAIEAAGSLDDYEIIFVNDGSEDRTGEVMDWLAARDERMRVLHNERNLGFGGAVKRGFEAARMNLVMMVPGENTVPSEGLTAIISRVGDADMIVPYPKNPEARSRARQLISKSFVLIVHILFGKRLRYYTGPVIYGRALFNEIDVRTNSHAYQLEVLIKLLARGHSYVETGMVIRDRPSGESKALKPRNMYRVLRTLWRLYRELNR